MNNREVFSPIWFFFLSIFLIFSNSAVGEVKGEASPVGRAEKSGVGERGSLKEGGSKDGEQNKGGNKDDGGGGRAGGEPDDGEGGGVKIEFTHTPPKEAVEGQPLTIKGVVMENDDLEDVFLHYRQVGEKRYGKIRMQLSRGIDYRATIPGGRVGGKGLQYYVSGIDISKKVLLLFASPEKPYTVRVVKPTAASQKEVKKKKQREEEEIEEVETIHGEEQVITASLKEQRIQQAPAVMTVITEDDIRAEGWRDVVELLRYIVGIDVNNNGLSPDVGFRGVNPRMSFGDKLVLLIDGHNMSWRQLNRNSSFISVDMIKRIEIIRGPGSALWGANALTGVINIITKPAQDLKGFSGVIGGSPLSKSYFFTVQGGKELVGGLTFRGSFSITRDRRGLLYAPIYEFKKISGIEYYSTGEEEETTYFYGHLSWRGLALSTLYYGLSLYAPMSTFSDGLGGDKTNLTAERFVVKLSWLTPLSNWGMLLLWSSYDFTGFSRGTEYEANPLSPLPSSSIANGHSGYFALYREDKGRLIFKGYYPVCRLLPAGAQTPCVELGPAPPAQPEVCYLLKSPGQPKTKGESYKIPYQCRPTYALGEDSRVLGRFIRPLKGYDHRVESGAQISVQPLSELAITAGVDFEYLNLIQIYSPDVWKELKLRIPHYTNIHLSGFTQAQYYLANFVEFTLGLRLDYDQQYGVVFTPRAAAVFTPGYGFYAKLLYGRAFKSPSFFDLYYARYPSTYGNPTLRPEDVNTWEVQLGWYRRRIGAFSINAYLSRFTNLIEYENKNSLDDFSGREKIDKNLLPPGEYIQKENASALWAYGGEAELRLFPVRGLHIYATGGLFFGRYDDGRPLTFASNWSTSLRVSYRYKFFQVALGVQLLGPKKVPARGFSLPGAVLPPEKTGLKKPVPAPNWSEKNDPSLQTVSVLFGNELPVSIHSFAAIQFLRILGHLDIVLRVDNLLNAQLYDANDILLTPRKGIDVMAWIRLRY